MLWGKREDRQELVRWALRPERRHLVELARDSDDVLGEFLALAGREHLMAAMKLEASADAIADLLAAVRRLGGGGGRAR